MGETVQVTPAELERFVSDIFVASGVDAQDAAAVAEHLVLAQRRGHQSHGIVRVPQYLARLRAGSVATRTEVTVVQEAPGMAVLDGGKGWGPTIGQIAMRMAMKKARETGIALVAARHCSHIGMLGYYTELAAREGMLGLCFAHGPRSAASVAPWGGREGRLITSPLSIGVPGARGPNVVLDMATTQAAQGKIMVARAEGRQIPLGLALDRDRNPTTDPAAALDGGLLLPMGGYKGYALAVMIDLLCGLLSADSDYPSPAGYDKVFIAINLAMFQPVAEAATRVDQLVALMKSTPRMPGVAEILVPGEPEARNEEASRELVPVGANIWADLVAAAKERGLVPPKAH